MSDTSVRPDDADALHVKPVEEHSGVGLTDQVVSVNVDLIDPNPRQPRSNFDLDALAELVASIRQVGILQPVVLRPVASRFQVVMGERRVRACREAGLHTVPALVRQTSDEGMLRQALIENVVRSDLNPLEQAAAYKELTESCGMTQDQVADLVGVSRAQVGNIVRLLRLAPAVQRRVAAGVLTSGHARALVTVGDPHVQERLAERIVAEGMTVRQVEEIVALGDLPGWEQDVPLRARARARKPSILPDLSSALGERFETRCKVVCGANKGSITFEFAGLEDLDRLLESIAPGMSSVRREDYSSVRPATVDELPWRRES